MIASDAASHSTGTASQSDSAVEIRDVVCQFGRIRALDGLSLDVAAGTVVGIVGPNGAGKTTLIDVICGLVRPTSGSARVLGQDVSVNAAALRARIGVLPQETALYDEVTARQNLQFAAALYDVPNSEARIDEVLQLVDVRLEMRAMHTRVREDLEDLDLVPARGGLRRIDHEVVLAGFPTCRGRRGGFGRACDRNEQQTGQQNAKSLQHDCFPCSKDRDGGA